MSFSIRLDNVKRKPWFIELLPWIGRGTCTALYPNVWLPKNVYLDVFSYKPNPYYIATLIHEQEHINRARKLGPFWFNFLYVFSGQFRFEEEMAAIRPQMIYLKSRGLNFDIESRAKYLSGWLYLWPVPYRKAYDRLKELWDEV